MPMFNQMQMQGMVNTNINNTFEEEQKEETKFKQ